ncbi:MAG TPA: flagellar basal body P-ring formation chaperone FlgA [Microvirga sp.]|jgi:flagella basal body P-ring formation protein FlgA
MTIQLFMAPITPVRVGRLNPSIVLRIALTVAAFTLAIVPAFAGDKPVLRGDVTATGDVLTLGDLVHGIGGPVAARPLFRAPALGETGTIQAKRILEAADILGVAGVETEGRAQVTVTRAARRFGVADIEAAVKQALELRHGLDARPLSIVFDGTPALLVAPDVKAPLSVEEVVYDRRSRRVSALMVVSTAPGERRAATRVTGSLVELAEVAVLNRTLARGDVVQASDLTIERRSRDTLPADLQAETTGLVGRVARRALAAGNLVRTGDLARPELVAKGDTVTIVYEVPGMVLTLRGRANEAGAEGDTIAVTNPQSKKILQAQVVAPGKVSVSAPMPGPVAVR